MTIVKTLIASAVIASASAASATEVAGFAPWANSNIQDRPDAVQVQVDFLRYGAPSQSAAAIGEIPDARQAAVTVDSWYMNQRS